MRRLGMTHDPADDFDHPLVGEGPLAPPRALPAVGGGLAHRPASPFTLGSLADHRLAASSDPYVPEARRGSCVLASRRQRTPEGKRTYGTMHQRTTRDTAA